MSPLEPGRIAYTGRTGGYPPVTNTSPFPTTGEPMVISEFGPSVHSSLPVAAS